MEENYKRQINKQDVIQKLKNFLGLPLFNADENLTTVDNIKKICVEKLCDVIGIKCKCNYKNQFFNYFSSVTGEAVCQLLNIPIVIAEDNYRLFKYNHINFVDYVKNLLDSDNMEESFADIFKFLDDNKNFILK